MSQLIRSIIPIRMTKCAVCDAETNLEAHHIFGAANRKLSDQDGLVIPLCYVHHRGRHGVHSNPELQQELHEIGQAVWMKHYGKTADEFRKRYGKNYL